MPNVNIKITNLAEIRHAFSQAPRLMNDEFKQALTKSALLVQRESMIRTPVKTGRLRASHVFDVKGFGIDMRAEVGPTANYGIFVHEGTRFMKGQPFLKDGAEASVNEIDYFFTRATQNALDKIGRMT